MKRYAESRGFHAVIEEEIPEGRGSVDVALEREGRRIACEISVTSTPEQEIGNIEKCLSASYEEVVVVSLEKRTLARVTRLLEEKFPAEVRSRIALCTPEELFAHLELKTLGSEVETVRGYKVKVGYKPTGDEDRKGRGRALVGIIGKSMRRMK